MIKIRRQTMPTLLRAGLLLGMLTAVATGLVSLGRTASAYSGLLSATANVASSMSISTGCDDGGGVTGTITGISGPFPKTFDIWVTDHKPGEGFFLEIPGSRQTVVATSSE